jgi:exonuclease III
MRIATFNVTGIHGRLDFRNAFAPDAGLRIDHLLLTPRLAGRLDRHRG